MSYHQAIIRWKCTGPGFLKGQYSREHTWTFDGGITLPASPSPSVVPQPYSNPASVDPEEAFVAAISSCHMLTYLWLASREGFPVESYEDVAIGVMTKNERGIPWVSSVRLSPKIAYGAERTPTPADEKRLHHLAHEQCFIANSVKTVITVGEPRTEDPSDEDVMTASAPEIF
jgi:organic hydroperoxide reductase OsmC/OhrA